MRNTRFAALLLSLLLILTAMPALADGEIIEINMLVVDETSVSGKTADVEAAINAITEAKIGVHVNMRYVEFGAYATQLTMAISSGEQIDLAVLTPSPSASFNTLSSMGGLADITDEIAGMEILDVVGDYINATTIDGRVYGVPAYRMLSSSQYIIMRKDVLEGIGMLEVAENMTKWSEFEEILEAVKQSDYNLAPIGASGNTGRLSFCDAPDDFSDTLTYDDIADSLALVGVRLDGDSTVFNFYKSEEYQRMLERMKKWYDNDWLYKDSAITTDTGDNLIKNGTIFSYIIGAEYGTEAVRKARTGYDCVCIPITSIPIATTTCTKFVWTVPATAVEKEAAVKMLNLMYTDPDIANLLAWGVEGVDYVVENGVAVFPEGITTDNVNYHTSDHLYGNQFIILPWGEGTSPDLRATQAEIMANARMSPYLGFTSDTSSISNEIAACNSVLGEYRAAIQSGAVDLSIYDTFIAALDDAGAQKIIDEYQAQLNAWLAENQ